MNAFEALMWRIEVDPRLRSTGCGLEILDCAPEWERFVAACDWGTRMAPRFRQKVVEPALGIGSPCWVNDPNFDLRYHVRRVGLSEGGGWPELLHAAEQIAMTPFDRARSPWESVLFEGLPDGRAAHLLKLHHATTDGMGGMQLFSQLHSRTRETNPAKPQPPPPPPEYATPLGLLREQLGRDARAVPALLRKAAGAVGALASPFDTVREAVRFGSSLARVIADPDVEGSPLLRRRSLSWRFLALDVAFADLRAAAKAASASLNDAFLAALLGAFRLYHEKLGCPIEKMPMAIPISVRREGDAPGGNRFAGARFAAPAGIADPRARMRAIGEMVRAARDEPAIDGLSLVAPALARLPAPLLSAVLLRLWPPPRLCHDDHAREPRRHLLHCRECRSGRGPRGGALRRVSDPRLLGGARAAPGLPGAGRALLNPPGRFASRCDSEGQARPRLVRRAHRRRAPRVSARQAPIVAPSRWARAMRISCWRHSRRISSRERSSAL
jgi:WS/DGAT/MGAT family acyltransferase